jgi:hypothetical protein
MLFSPIYVFLTVFLFSVSISLFKQKPSKKRTNNYNILLFTVLIFLFLHLTSQNSYIVTECCWDCLCCKKVCCCWYKATPLQEVIPYGIDPNIQNIEYIVEVMKNKSHSPLKTTSNKLVSSSKYLDNVALTDKVTSINSQTRLIVAGQLDIDDDVIYSITSQTSSPLNSQKNTSQISKSSGCELF